MVKGCEYVCFIDALNHLTLKCEYRFKEIAPFVLLRGIQFGLKTLD